MQNISVSRCCQRSVWYTVTRTLRTTTCVEGRKHLEKLKWLGKPTHPYDERFHYFPKDFYNRKNPKSKQLVEDLERTGVYKGASSWYQRGRSLEKQTFFPSIPEKQTFCLKKPYYAWFFSKLLVRDKVVFLTKYEKKTYCFANSSAPPPHEY